MVNFTVGFPCSLLKLGEFADCLINMDLHSLIYMILSSFPPSSSNKKSLRKAFNMSEETAERLAIVFCRGLCYYAQFY